MAQNTDILLNFNFTSLKCCCNGDITIQYCSGADPKATRSGKIEVDKFL